MSGLETVKIIVDAEKEGSNMINEAQARASEIRKQVDALIETEREDRLSVATKQAASIVQTAESEGKSEAILYQEESKQNIKKVLQRASANRAAAVKTLFDMIMG
jgi:vacuolar-type H+-ATPase subunit H